MNSIWDVPYIVVDVETSGSHPQNNRIIEIACVTVMGGEIISKYSSLVNPHQLIPKFIADMTGISNEMAVLAPEAEEVFPEISRIFSKSNAVFVAHNARFDWGFVSEFFHANGSEHPKVPRLCTLKLARRLLTKSQRKNVGALADYFNIAIKDRHRAMGDAAATAFILLELLEMAEQEQNIQSIDDLLIFQNKPIKNFKPPTETYKRLQTKIAQLPSEPGVYYFSDKKDNILYVGKSKSLKDRVRSYFFSETITSKKISEMMKRLYDIRWETTDTELSALLLESRKIKEHQPPFNTMSKVLKKYPFVKLTKEDYPKLEMTYSVESDGAEYFGPFRSPSLVEDIIFTLEKQFKVRKCEKPFNPAIGNKPCFYYHIKRCDAPCALEVSPSEYQKEMDKIRYFLGGFSDGIIKQLEAKMFELADKLDFEKAQRLKTQIGELKNIFERKYSVPTSINANNLIFINPASSIDKTAEIFLIKTGKLHHQILVGRMAPLEEINEKIEEIFFNGDLKELELSLQDTDELRIIGSWTHRRQNIGSYVYIDGKSYSEVINELETTLRSLSFENDELLEETEDEQEIL